MIDWMTSESVRGCASRNLYVILDDHADFNRRRRSQDSSEMNVQACARRRANFDSSPLAREEDMRFHKK